MPCSAFVEEWKGIWQLSRDLGNLDTEIIDGHLLHTQGCNSLPRTFVMTVLSSEMPVISLESELQLCTNSVGDYNQLLS